LAILLLGVAIALTILLLVALLGPLWERLNSTILGTEARRYLFAILFISLLFAIGEWLVRSYRRAKQRAAERLQAQYSAILT
jgi:hypothetical protein